MRPYAGIYALAAVLTLLTTVADLALPHIMKNIININWLKAALVRAVKTVAQTAVATIGTSALLNQVDWVMVGSAAVLAGVLSLLTSVAGLPEVKA